METLARSLEMKLGLLGFSSFFASVAASAYQAGGSGKQIHQASIDTNTYRLGFLSSRLSCSLRGGLSSSRLSSGGGFSSGSGLLKK